ncbi:MAG: WYL domain-containing protein [Nanoarchaeota archaeon]
MVSFTKSQKKRLKQILTKFKDKEAKEILEKITKRKNNKYVYDLKSIKDLLKKAYEQRKCAKIKYYSLSSDEIRWRKISIYKFDPNFIIAYCHLRNEERTFVISRISQATILDNSYKIPKGWKPGSIVKSI